MIAAATVTILRIGNSLGRSPGAFGVEVNRVNARMRHSCAYWARTIAFPATASSIQHVAAFSIRYGSAPGGADELERLPEIANRLLRRTHAREVQFHDRR